MGPVVGQPWYAEKERGIRATAPVDDRAALCTIGYVVSRYGSLTGTDLEHLTHTEEPWLRADAGRDPRKSAAIKVSWLHDHSIAAAAEESAQQSADLPDQQVRSWLADAVDRLRDEVHPDDQARLRSRLASAR